MRKIYYCLCLMMITVVFSSCNNDDDIVVDGDLNEIIYGKWHSYKVVGYWKGESVTKNIQKEGEFSQFYIELDFNRNGICTSSGWKMNENNISEWDSEKDEYYITDGFVNIVDKNNNDIVPLGYDNNGLYLRFTNYLEGSLLTGYLYFKK